MSKTKHPLLLLAAGLFLAVLFWRYFSQQRSGQVVTGFAQNPLENLQSTSDRTNVVFLGIGGSDHQGGDLTDSMILFSYYHPTHALTLIPLPRDIWVPTLAAKLNTAYHYGGLDLTRLAVAEITGLPIHYGVVLDFSGFVKMIDAVGGIDVVISTSFDDAKFPIPGLEDAEPESARYEHLHFEAGPAHLDGATALKFARSRHSEGIEGTDFARSARQELVIVAFKQKILSTQTLLNGTTLQNLLDSLDDSFVTNASNIEIGAFIRLFLDSSRSPSPSRSLDLTSYFFTPANKNAYLGQWVLIPQTSLIDIHAYVEQSLSR